MIKKVTGWRRMINHRDKKRQLLFFVSYLMSGPTGRDYIAVDCKAHGGKSGVCET